MARLKEEAGAAASTSDENENEDEDAVLVQLRSISETTTPHVDRFCFLDEGESGLEADASMKPVVEDEVGIIFLNTNEDATFVHGDTRVPVVAGSMVKFLGSTFHHTDIQKGQVRIAGPFHLATMRSVGSCVPTTETCNYPSSYNDVCDWTENECDYDPCTHYCDETCTAEEDGGCKPLCVTGTVETCTFTYTSSFGGPVCDLTGTPCDYDPCTHYCDECDAEGDGGCKPLCGNGIIDAAAGEECDGDDATACSAGCEPDCTCTPTLTEVLESLKEQIYSAEGLSNGDQNSLTNHIDKALKDIFEFGNVELALVKLESVQGQLILSDLPTDIVDAAIDLVITFIGNGLPVGAACSIGAECMSNHCTSVGDATSTCTL